MSKKSKKNIKPKHKKTTPKTSGKKHLSTKAMQKRPGKKSKKTIPNLFDKYIGRWGWAIASFLLLALLIYVFRDFLWQKYVYLFNDIGSDTLNVFYPNRISHGEDTSRWSFYEGMGQARAAGANIFTQIMHYPIRILRLPFTTAGYLLGANSMPHNILYNEFVLIFFAGFFFYFYLRTLDFSQYAAIIGCLLYAFSGYVLMGSSWYHTHRAFDLAFLLFAFEQLFRKKRWIFFPYAIFMINGYTYFLFGMFMLIYSLFRFFDEKGWQPKELGILYLKMAGLAIIGVGINLTSTIARANMILNSPRGSGNTSYAEALSSKPVFDFEQSIHYITFILRSFSTDLMGNGSKFRGWHNYLEAPATYSGVISLVLLPQVFAVIRKQRKFIFGAFLLVWAIIVIFPYFRYAFYAFTGDYYKAVMNYCIIVTFIFFSTYALNAIIQEGKKINLIVLGGTLVLLFIALYYPYLPDNYQIIDKDLRAVIRNFIIFYAILLALLNIGKIRLYIQIALLLTIIFEIGYLANITVNRREAVKTEELQKKEGFNDYSVEAIQYLDSIEGDNFYRVEKEYSSSTAIHGSLNDAKIQNYYGTSNYSSFNQLNYIRFLQETGIIKKGDETSARWAPGLRSRPFLMGYGSVKYMLTKSDTSGYLRFGFKPVKKIHNVTILKNPFYIPFGFTTNQYIPFNEFKHYNQIQKDLSMLGAVVLDSSQVPEYNESLKKFDVNSIPENLSWNYFDSIVNDLRKDTLQITEFKHHNIKGKIAVDSSRMLLFTIPFDPGWHAFVDGKEVPVEMIDIGFTGLMLPKGEHTIELKFVPRGQKLGTIVSGIFFFIYIGLIIWYYRKDFVKLYKKIAAKKK